MIVVTIRCAKCHTRFEIGYVGTLKTSPPEYLKGLVEQDGTIYLPRADERLTSAMTHEGCGGHLEVFRHRPEVYSWTKGKEKGKHGNQTSGN